MKLTATLVAVLEVLGGARPIPIRYSSSTATALARGVWWLVLLLLAWAFAGRTTKFVYVDF
jgi:hypothetical protein